MTAPPGVDGASAPLSALSALQRRAGVAPNRIPRRAEASGELPLSLNQEQVWFLDQMAPGTYNVPMGIRLRGPLDRSALADALNVVTARQEILRTSFANSGGRPIQVVHPARPVPLTFLDLSASVEAQQVQLARVATRQANQRFDLERAPLLRLLLVGLGADHHVLLVTFHHIVFDGWSVEVFLREVTDAYGERLTGGSAGGCELPVQYADYALWQRGQLRGESLERLTAYWRQNLAGAPVLELPTDRPRPPVQAFDGAAEYLELTGDLTDALRSLARREGVTMFMLVLAAFVAVLQRYSSQDDIVVGTPSANRSRTELEPLIGYFVAMLPVRADLSGDPSFLQLLQRVREATLGAYAHQDLPLAKLVEVLRPERDPSRPPVFQVGFTLTGPAGPPLQAGELALEMLEDLVGTSNAKLDLSLFVGECGRRLNLRAEYATALFDADRVRRMLVHLRVLLEGVAVEPSRRLSELPLLSPQERVRQMIEWNRTGTDVPTGCLHGLFEAQVAAAPDHLAAVDGQDSITYAELDQRANQLARYLRNQGVGPDVLVGVCMHRSLGRLVAVLGILKAGGAYVPLDPASPPERLAFMVADSETGLVLAEEATLPVLTGVLGVDSSRISVLDRAWPEILAHAHTPPVCGVTSRDRAYVIYTSGSTGRPKGVAIEHRSVGDFVTSAIDAFAMGPTDRVLQYASLSFDSSVFEMFSALLSGATLVLASPEASLSPPLLAQFLRDQRITVTDLPPAVMALLPGASFPDLRLTLVGGEPVSADLVRDWARPHRRFFNGYGPTEATVAVTLMECDAASDEPPPIGKPMANHRIYVLDRNRNPVPVGVPGELYVGGVGLARDYLRRPELTAERFVADPFSDTLGERLYRTGDIVAQRLDGNLRFLGRTDDQVKVAGLRVELGEVEAVLAAHPSVHQAVVVTRGASAQRQLVGYLTPVGVTPPDRVELRHYLGRHLPSYMHPSHLVVMDALPLNSSGKVDRRLLPEPQQSAVSDAPKTLVEAALAELFAEVLALQDVGARESFFDLGGTSLQAMQLLARLRDVLGLELDVTVIFRAPTVTDLARLLRSEHQVTDEPSAEEPSTDEDLGVEQPSPRLVRLSSVVSTTELLCAPAVGGSAYPYAELAHALAGELTVYAVHEDPPVRTATSVEDTARRHLAVIRRHRPSGPYRLAGWSFGGLVAFEMARQLEGDEQEVELLVLLDTSFPMGDVGSLSENDLAGIFVAGAAAALGRASTVPAGLACGPPGGQLAWAAKHLGAPAAEAAPAERAGRDRPSLASESQDWNTRFAAFTDAHRAMRRYRPRPLRAPTLVVSARASRHRAQEWGRVLAGGGTRVVVDGDHHTLLRSPHVADVADVLRSWRG